MSKYLKSITLAFAVFAITGPAFAEKFGLGRPALLAEVAAWDWDINALGEGLPSGSGDALVGDCLLYTSDAADE